MTMFMLRPSLVGVPHCLDNRPNGVELYYGRTDDSGKPTYRGSFISITEFPRANAEVTFQGLAMFPTGAAIVSDRTATMKAHGLYVIIRAGRPDEAIAAARALGR